MSTHRIAIVQPPPVLLDRAATMARAVESLHEAAADGAALVVFPETFLPGYPAWIWRLKPGADMAPAEQLHAGLLTQALRLDGDDLKPLAEAARERGVTVVCGLHERDADFSRATLYPQLQSLMARDDLLLIAADHGCDPLTAGTDHTREFVPVLGWRPGLQSARPLGERASFADLGATLADFFGVPVTSGMSFLGEVR